MAQDLPSVQTRTVYALFILLYKEKKEKTALNFLDLLHVIFYSPTHIDSYTHETALLHCADASLLVLKCFHANSNGILLLRRLP